MPPFVYRSLKDFMRASATAQTRQELLQKLITNAAKRKTQFHVDATDARLVTSPETFGMNLSKQIMNKQANMALLRQILSPAMKQLQTGAAKTMGGLKTYGKRLMGDSTLMPLHARGGVLKDLEQTLQGSLQPLIDVKPLNRRLRLLNNKVDRANTVADRVRLGDKAYAAFWNAENAGKHNQMQRLIAGGGEGFRSVPGMGQMGEVSKLVGQNNNNIAKELEAIRKTRLYTGGAASGAALGGIGGAALNNTAGTKQSMTMPQPSSRGQMKKIQMPAASPTKPDCDPEGVQMSNNKQAFMGIGGLAGMATAPKGEEDLSIGRGALRGVGTGLGVGTGAVTGGLAGGLGGAGLGAILGALARSSGNRYMSPGLGASQIAPLGMLAGGLGGAVYGGYKGNKATKALLDKTAPIGEKKKKDKEDDKEVKEAAAVVLAQLKRNHNK